MSQCHSVATLDTFGISNCNTLAVDLQKTKTKNDNESQVCLRVTIITSKINYVVKH